MEQVEFEIHYYYDGKDIDSEYYTLEYDGKMDEDDMYDVVDNHAYHQAIEWRREFGVDDDGVLHDIGYDLWPVKESSTQFRAVRYGLPSVFNSY